MCRLPAVCAHAVVSQGHYSKRAKPDHEPRTKIRLAANSPWWSWQHRKH